MKASPMKIIRSKEFRATRPWGALDIANMRGITTPALDRRAVSLARQ